MDRIEIAEGVSLSRLVYGLWRLGDDSDTSPAHIRAKFEACLEQGITTLDTAAVYGGFTTEELMGTALTPELRAKFEIVTKCGIVVPTGRHEAAKVKHYDTSRDHIISSLDHSLRLMGVDHVDLFLIHRPDPLMDHQETGAALDEIVRAGKVRAVGVSNFRPYDWEVLQSAMTTPLATNQIELSLTASDALTNGDVVFHQRQGDPIMAWSPLGGGSLMTGDGPVQAALDKVASDQGVDRAAVATAWLLAHPARILPILGTNSLPRIRALSDALKVSMDRETWFDLYTAGLGREVA